MSKVVTERLKAILEPAWKNSDTMKLKATYAEADIGFSRGTADLYENVDPFFLGR